MTNSDRAMRRLLWPKRTRRPKILGIARPKSRRERLLRVLTSR